MFKRVGDWLRQPGGDKGLEGQFIFVWFLGLGALGKRYVFDASGLELVKRIAWTAIMGFACWAVLFGVAEALRHEPRGKRILYELLFITLATAILAGYISI